MFHHTTRAVKVPYVRKGIWESQVKEDTVGGWMGSGDTRALSKTQRDLAQPEGVGQTSISRCPDELKQFLVPTQKCIIILIRILTLL